MRQLLFLLVLITWSGLHAQVGVNTTFPDPSSAMDIKSNDKGLLIPRMDADQRNAINLPANGLMIYQNDNQPGFYYNAGSPATPQWVAMLSGPPGSSAIYKIPISQLPFTITQSGSYILTQNLTGSNGITIQANNVSIDLNFSSLTGSPGNTASGITISGSRTGVTIYNGYVQGWGEDGISAATANSFVGLNLQLLNNGGDGLVCGNECTLSQCHALSNGLDGLDVGNQSRVSDCTTGNNLDTGIECDSRCHIQHCVTSANGDQGLFTGAECIITEVNAYQNIHYGIRTGNHNQVNHCLASFNGFSGFYLSNASMAQNNLAKLNTQHGFEAGQDVVMKQNTADSNTGNGFFSSFNGGKLQDNNSSDNAIGYEITGSDWLITTNTASGNIVNSFSISGTNKLATILTAANLNTNTNPFANISF